MLPLFPVFKCLKGCRSTKASNTATKTTTTEDSNKGLKEAERDRVLGCNYGSIEGHYQGYHTVASVYYSRTSGVFRVVNGRKEDEPEQRVQN